MPTKIYFRGGANVLVNGETEKAAFILPPPVIRWFKRTVIAIATNNHPLKFNKRDVLCLEFQPDKEFQTIVATEKKKAEDAAMASKCRRCGRDNPREASFCMTCSAPLVKKEEPKRIIPTGGN
jgi:hypothetical protein